MTAQDQYTPSTTARRAEDAFANVSDQWAQNIQNLTEQFATPRIPTIPADPTAFVEQWFDFTDRLSKVNREYVLNLTGAWNSLGGAVRQHVDGLGEAVRDQVQAVSSTTKDQLEKVAEAEREQVEQAEREQREQIRRAERAERDRVRKAEEAERDRIEQAEQAERDRAREARNAERQKARQARQSARERYEGLTKADLSAELANRDLPKSGTVEELIERLVDADTDNN
jgi:flagellar biosynthesis GTPase FlhF